MGLQGSVHTAVHSNQNIEWGNFFHVPSLIRKTESEPMLVKFINRNILETSQKSEMLERLNDGGERGTGVSRGGRHSTLKNMQLSWYRKGGTAQRLGLT